MKENKNINQSLTESELNNRNQCCMKYGNRIFFNKGNNSIMPNCIGLPSTMLFFIFMSGYAIYNVCVKFYSDSFKSFICLLVVEILISGVFFFQGFNVAFSNPGFYFPRQQAFEEEMRNKILLTKINNKSYVLKYCTTCHII